MIDGEATVKTFKRRDGHVWLMPHNPAYEPDPRRRRHDPRPGHRGAAPGLRPPNVPIRVPRAVVFPRMATSTRAGSPPAGTVSGERST